MASRSDIGLPTNQESVGRSTGVRVYRPKTSEPAIDLSVALARLQSFAAELGLPALGVTSVQPLDDDRARFEAWLDAGYHGTMSFLERAPRRAEPSVVFPEAKAVIVAAMPYPGGSELVPLRRGKGSPLIAGYAMGQDYHRGLKETLHQLGAALANILGRPITARVVVDTAPLLERALARRAGVGFCGKSTLLIAPGLGSYLLLGALLIDQDLPATPPNDAGCGQCRLCLDACPTGAFVAPHQLDARRCIAYLTIEHQGSIPRELRAAIGLRVFGCDVCQDVCPYNHGIAPGHPEEATPRQALLDTDLIALLKLSSSNYRKLVRGSALSRANRSMLQRNAAVALGNSDRQEAVSPLLQAASESPYPLVREHASWALGRLARHAPRQIREFLQTVAVRDVSQDVRQEAIRSLEEWPEGP